MWQLSPESHGELLWCFKGRRDMTRLEFLKSLSRWIMGNGPERHKIEARIPLQLAVDPVEH